MTTTTANTTAGTTARHPWVPYLAAGAGAALSLKAVLVVATDDGGPGAMAVLYLGGLLLGLGAAVGAGLRQPGRLRGLAVGAGSSLLLVLWIMGLGDSLKPLVGAVSESEAVQAEAAVLLAGLVLLALAWRARVRDLRHTA